MKKKIKTHGGAGRGQGRKVTTGRTAVSLSVSMTQPEWDALDARRGDEARGSFIARKLKLAGSNKAINS